MASGSVSGINSSDLCDPVENSCTSRELSWTRRSVLAEQNSLSAMEASQGELNQDGSASVPDAINDSHTSSDHDTSSGRETPSGRETLSGRETPSDLDISSGQETSSGRETSNDSEPLSARESSCEPDGTSGTGRTSEPGRRFTGRPIQPEGNTTGRKRGRPPGTTMGIGVMPFNKKPAYVKHLQFDPQLPPPRAPPHWPKDLHTPRRTRKVVHIPRMPGHQPLTIYGGPNGREHFDRIPTQPSQHILRTCEDRPKAKSPLKLPDPVAWSKDQFYFTNSFPELPSQCIVSLSQSSDKSDHVEERRLGVRSKVSSMWRIELMRLGMDWRENVVGNGSLLDHNIENMLAADKLRGAYFRLNNYRDRNDIVHQFLEIHIWLSDYFPLSLDALLRALGLMHLIRNPRKNVRVLSLFTPSFAEELKNDSRSVVVSCIYDRGYGCFQGHDYTPVLLESPNSKRTAKDKAFALLESTADFSELKSRVIALSPSLWYEKSFEKAVMRKFAPAEESRNLSDFLPPYCYGFTKKSFPNTIARMENKVLFISGGTALGKTTWVKAAFKDYFFVNNFEALKHFDPSRHKGIIFDEMTDDHKMYPQEKVMAFLDVESTRTIRILYDTVVIPQHTPRVITSNFSAYKLMHSYKEKYGEDTFQAMYRRIAELHIPAPTYVPDEATNPRKINFSVVQDGMEKTYFVGDVTEIDDNVFNYVGTHNPCFAYVMENQVSPQPCVGGRTTLNFDQQRPSTEIPGPSTAVPGPSTAVPGPSTAVPGPSTAVPGPSTAAPAPLPPDETFDEEEFMRQQVLPDEEIDFEFEDEEYNFEDDEDEKDEGEKDEGEKDEGEKDDEECEENI